MDRRVVRAAAAVVAITLTATTAGCPFGQPGRIEGAGPELLAPLFREWIDYLEYEDDPDFAIEYRATDSGDEITQFMDEEVDWATSERYLTDAELAEAERRRGCPAVQFPVAFGPVHIALGDPRLDGLVLDAEVISAIFRGEITTYQDSRIAALNPDWNLPDHQIVPVNRSDGSATTLALTTWLEDQDAAWAESVGSGAEVDWPAGTVGTHGEQGVLDEVSRRLGGVGYLSAPYQLEPSAQVVNADGYPASATSPPDVGAAVAQLELPDDFQFDTLGIGDDGYPIIAPVWSVFWECGYDERTAERLRYFWSYALGRPNGLGYLSPVDDAVSPALQRIGAS